jgi:hypothetical protein
MLLRALVVLLLALGLALPSSVEAKRKIRRRPPASQAVRVDPGPTEGDTADGDDAPPPSTASGGPVLSSAYSGVRPGKSGQLPGAPKAGGAPFLTWSGFMMTEAGSRVFLQLTQQVQYTVAQSPKELALTLKGCRIHKRNNARPVNTRFFATPVAKVQARQRGRDVVVTIGLRKPVSVQPRLETGEGGYQFLMLDFPAEAAPASQAAE